MPIRFAAAFLAAVVMAAAPAMAATAVVNKDSSIRVGPSGTTEIVNHVKKGQTVGIIKCISTRCNIEVPGTDGWIRKSFLDF